MADEMELKHARSVYETVCASFDKEGWKYSKDDEQMKVFTTFNGEDIPMDLSFISDAKRQILLLMCRMPFTVPQDKSADIALAVSEINSRIADGSFDYNVSDGSIFFRLTNSFMERDLSFELVKYMVICSCQTVDDMNDKFLMICKGVMSLEQFVQFLDNK